MSSKRLYILSNAWKEDLVEGSTTSSFLLGKSISIQCNQPPGSIIYVRISPDVQSRLVKNKKKLGSRRVLNLLNKAIKLPTSFEASLSLTRVRMRRAFTISYFPFISSGTSDKASHVDRVTFGGSHSAGGNNSSEISKP